ncbi:MAG TPA: LPS export ABC transporter periplasmic protein LptC [Alphaproteobacteria bacterium]|nr:LPS export ABC transporter periplasmic protein LptC [Alphaproteobacteria bacterium]
MDYDKRSFIIFDKQRRLKRWWQFFFTGWGLVMITALVAGTLFTRQLLWTPISAINMKEIVNNQFQMTNAAFAGTDKNGNPFKINAAVARQEYTNPDVLYIEKISGTVVRISDNKKITDKINANTGKYNSKDNTVTLIGNVRVDSDNGDKILTDELVIQL